MPTSWKSEFKQEVLLEMYIQDPDENICWIFVVNILDSDDLDSDDSDSDGAELEGTSGGEH